MRERQEKDLNPLPIPIFTLLATLFLRSQPFPIHKFTIACRLWVFLQRFSVLVPQIWASLSVMVSPVLTLGIEPAACAAVLTSASLYRRCLNYWIFLRVMSLVYGVDKGIWGVFLTYPQGSRFLLDTCKKFCCFIFSFDSVLWLMQPWGRKSCTFPTETLFWPNCSSQLWVGTAELLW